VDAELIFFISLFLSLSLSPLFLFFFLFFSLSVSPIFNFGNTIAPFHIIPESAFFSLLHKIGAPKIFLLSFLKYLHSIYCLSIFSTFLSVKQILCQFVVKQILVLYAYSTFCTPGVGHFIYVIAIYISQKVEQNDTSVNTN